MDNSRSDVPQWAPITELHASITQLLGPDEKSVPTIQVGLATLADKAKGVVMQNPYKVFGRFMQDDRGSTPTEYAMIAALIAIGIIAGVSTLGYNLNKYYFGKIADEVEKVVKAN